MCEEMNKPDILQNTEKSCVSAENMSKLQAHSLRMVVISIRRALVGAIRLCDHVIEQLKTR